MTISFTGEDSEEPTDHCILSGLDEDGSPVWTSSGDADLFEEDVMDALFDPGSPGSGDPDDVDVDDSVEDVEFGLTIPRVADMLSNFEGAISRARAEIPEGLESHNRRLLNSKLDQIEELMVGPAGVRGALFGLKNEGFDLSNHQLDLRANLSFMKAFAMGMRGVAGILQGHNEGARYSNGRAMRGGFFHDFHWYRLKGDNRATPPMFVRRAFDHLFIGEGGFCSGLYPTFSGTMDDMAWGLPNMTPADVSIPNAPYILTQEIPSFDPQEEGVALSEDTPSSDLEALMPDAYISEEGDPKRSLQVQQGAIQRPTEATSSEVIPVAHGLDQVPDVFKMMVPEEGLGPVPVPVACCAIDARLEEKQQSLIKIVRGVWQTLIDLPGEGAIDREVLALGVRSLARVITRLEGVNFLRNLDESFYGDWKLILNAQGGSIPVERWETVLQAVLEALPDGDMVDVAYLDPVRVEQDCRSLSRWAMMARAHLMVDRGVDFMSPTYTGLSDRLGSFIFEGRDSNEIAWWTDLMNALTHLRPVLDRAKVIRRCDADNHNMGSFDHPIVEHESLSSAQGPAIDPWYFPIVRPDQFSEPNVSVDELIYLASDMDGIRPFGWREAFIEQMAATRLEMAWAGVPGTQYFSPSTSSTGIPFEMLGAGTLPFGGRGPVLSDVNNLAPEAYVVNVSLDPEPSSCPLEKAALEAEVVVENSSMSASTQKRGRWAWFKRAAKRVAKAGMVAIAGLANTSGQAILSPISMASSPVSQTAPFEEAMEEVSAPVEVAPVEVAQPSSSVSDVSSDAALSLAPEDKQARATTLWTALEDSVEDDGLTILAHHDRVQCALSQTEVEIPSKYLNSRGEFNRVITILEGYYWERPAEIETAAQLQARAERDESLQPLWNEVKAFYMDLDEVEQAVQVANSEVCNDAPVSLPSIEKPSSNELGSLMPMPTLTPGSQISDSGPSLLGPQPGSRLKGMMKARMAAREKRLEQRVGVQSNASQADTPFMPMRPQDQGNVYGYVNRLRRRVQGVAPQQLAA